MEIREIHQKKHWEDFVLAEKPHTFLQSWNWGEFNKAMGNKVWRLGIYAPNLQPTTNNLQPTDNLQLVGAALVIKIAARRGTFLFLPYGPVIGIKYQVSSIKQEVLKVLINYLEQLAKEENCGFIRISPILLKTQENEKLFKDSGFRKAPIHMHAETMWILDVTPAEDELLKNMRKTTRYLIRKAQSDGVEIIKSSEPEYLKIFQKLYEETARRQKFSAYGEGYIKGELESFRGDNQIQIFLAKYNSEFTAGAVIIFCGDSAFYHQGASSDKYSKIPAPYLLQWEIIREAKRRGLRYYNFWGIVENQKETGRENLDHANSHSNILQNVGMRIMKMMGFKRGHPWAGLTLFKKGFGGFSEEYLPAQDLILKKSYWIAYLIEKARKARRGL